MPQISLDENTNNTTSTDSNWKPNQVPQLTVDVYKKGESIFIISTVAGVAPGDIDVVVENNTLSIKGFRKKPYNAEEGLELLLEECVWGEFFRELTINENLDVNKVKAVLTTGILTIEVPIMKVVGHRRVQVEYK